MHMPPSSPLDGSALQLCVSSFRLRVERHRPILMSSLWHTPLASFLFLSRSPFPSASVTCILPVSKSLSLSPSLLASEPKIGLRRRQVAITHGDVWHRARSLVDKSFNPCHSCAVWEALVQEASELYTICVLLMASQLLSRQAEFCTQPPSGSFPAILLHPPTVA